jgi:hypothetical protein
VPMSAVAAVRLREGHCLRGRPGRRFGCVSVDMRRILDQIRVAKSARDEVYASMLPEKNRDILSDSYVTTSH